MSGQPLSNSRVSNLSPGVGVVAFRVPFRRREATLLKGQLVFFAILVLFAYMLLPFRWQESLALFGLEPPVQALSFGTVFPFVGILEVTAVGVAAMLCFFGAWKALKTDRLFLAYGFVNIISFLQILWLASGSRYVYWDWLVEFLRFSSVYLLFASVAHFCRKKDLLFISAVAVLLGPSLVLLAAGYIAPDVLAERSGRLNAPGLELTSTAHVGAMLLLLSLVRPTRWFWRAVPTTLGVGTLLVAGSRLAIGISWIVIALLLSTRGSAWRRMAVMSVFVAGTLLLILVPLGDELAVGRFLIFLERPSVMREEFLLIRGAALQSSLGLLRAHPLGILNSDWAVQAELVGLGFPSHTHSNYIQMYLRYGPLVLIIWYIFLSETRRGFRAGSPYAYLLLFVLLGSALDYYAFVTKAMIVVFVASLLNREWIAQNASGKRSPSVLAV